jgi:hypothetical protein
VRKQTHFIEEIKGLFQNDFGLDSQAAIASAPARTAESTIPCVNEFGEHGTFGASKAQKQTH